MLQIHRTYNIVRCIFAMVGKYFLFTICFLTQQAVQKATLKATKRLFGGLQYKVFRQYFLWKKVGYLIDKGQNKSKLF